MLPTLYSIRNQGWLPLFFNDILSDNWLAPKLSATSPAINVSEDENAYFVEVAASGMTKEDFEIVMTEDDDIVLSVEKTLHDKKVQNDRTFIRREFGYSKFVKRLRLPDNIDKENIFVKSYNDFINSNDKDKYSQYEYTSIDERISKSAKISYLRKVEIYDWIIGTGFNLDNLSLKIKEKQKELEKDYDEHMYVAIIIATSMTFLFLISSMLVSRLLQKKFLLHKKDLEKQIIENKKQKETLIRAQEVVHIGDWKLDLQTNEVFWSDEIIRIFGFEKKDKNMFGFELLKKIMVPEDISPLEESINNCINKNVEHKFIYRIKNVDFWVLM